MIQGLEALARAGRFDDIKKTLRTLNVRELPRRDALPVANLARRAGLTEFSLRVLNPIVRPERPGKAVPPTPAETVEYAASLRNLGAIAEASELLEEIDCRSYPLAEFHRALCLIAEWYYGRAIPLLRSYLAGTEGSSYAREVARANLLAALIADEQLDEARSLDGEFRSQIDRAAHPLLYRYGLELGARLEITCGRWRQALIHLKEAEQGLEVLQDPVSDLLVNKWIAVAHSMESGRVTSGLTEARILAANLRQPETVRDCDFYIAKLTRDQDLFTRLYFGTPFDSFRKKIQNSVGAMIELPDCYLWSGDRKGPAKRRFDLVLARDTAGPQRKVAELSPGLALHRFLIVLCQDLYKPVPRLSLFSKLFPDDRYNPETSPNRVHHISSRFHKWLRTEGLPLQLEEVGGAYALRFTGPCSIGIPREPLPLEPRHLRLIRLRSLMKQPSFNTHEAMKTTGETKPTISRLLKWAVETGMLRREGWGPSSRYHF